MITPRALIGRMMTDYRFGGVVSIYLSPFLLSGLVTYRSGDRRLRAVPTAVRIRSAEHGEQLKAVGGNARMVVVELH